MEDVAIYPATNEERKWAAILLAGTDPWLTLGIKPEKILESCNNPQYQVIIAHRQGKACGVIIIHPNGVAGSPYIKSIAVDNEFRNMGVGAALIRHTEELFRIKARYLFLCVSSFNTRAQALYEKLGFKVVGELKDYIIDGASEILMSKRLK
jgi:ribosomal protein S18 acetylase RimI-like enzyme